MKPFSNYKETQAYGNYEQLPKGGYILKILGVEALNRQDGSIYFKISADIAEGAYKDFFLKEYRGQQTEEKKWHCNYLLGYPKDDGTERDMWTKRAFKTFTNALEDSNANYHFDWDETKWKGKVIGGLFNEREWQGSDGKIRRSTNWGGVCATDKIVDGTYRLPKDKLLQQTAAAPVPGDTDFMKVPEGIEDELPFA